MIYGGIVIGLCVVISGLNLRPFAWLSIGLPAGLLLSLTISNDMLVVAVVNVELILTDNFH